MHSAIKASARKELTRAARRMSIQSDLARNALDAVNRAEEYILDLGEDEKDSAQKILAERMFRYDHLRKEEVKHLMVLEAAILHFKAVNKITYKEEN